LSETKIMNEILLATSAAGHRLFRNNVGLGWVGRVTIHDHAHICMAHPRPLRAGLCAGSSDIIGWHSVTITPGMIGKRVAVFTALEVKTAKGRVSDLQQNFLNVVTLHGGCGIVARSIQDAERGIQEWQLISKDFPTNY